jgi:hypothetical protein
LTPITTAILSPAILLALLLPPQLNAGNNPDNGNLFIQKNHKNTVSKVSDDPAGDLIYDNLGLEKAGLKKEVFSFAYKGYKNLMEKGLLNKEGIITICDFSQSSKKKRLYLIDLNECKLLLNTYVAHGRNSGGEYAKKFSNKPESLQSSLGFYKTKETYFGSHGLALTLSGLEKGFNDKAELRKIVVHGSDYIDDRRLLLSGFMGRSLGCPAIPNSNADELINTIKNGSCLFIYHPTKNYLTGSKILNG